MTLQKFKRIKLAFVVILAIVFSQAIVFRSFIIPVVLMISSALILMYLRRRVTGVIADERDYATGGKAALLAIQVFSWIATISMFALYAFRDINPTYEPIAITLAFTTCFLMLLYALIFRYLNHFNYSDRKNLYIFLAIVLFFIVIIFSLRVFSGEDNWICVDGNWQKHGQPSFAAPSVECK